MYNSISDKAPNEPVSEAEMMESEISIAIQLQEKEEFQNEESLAKGLESRLGWNLIHSIRIADLAWSRMHAENNPSPPSDTADTRLLNLILELDSSGNLKPVLRGLPSDVWFKLFNAVEDVGNGD